MKTLFLSLILAAAAMAETVTLVWDKNPEADVVSYTLVYGKTGGAVDQQVTTANTTVSLDMPPGKWTFAVYATNDEGLKSPCSESVSTTVLKPAPSAPKLLRIPTRKVEGSNNKTKWKNVAEFPVPVGSDGKDKWKFLRLAGK